MQPSNEANMGFGKEPNPWCLRCGGRGFTYGIESYAITCPCKIGVRYKSGKNDEENTPPSNG